jgi:hypothetical protein
VPLPSTMMVGNVANRDRIMGAMEQSAAASLDRFFLAAAGGLESGFKDFDSSTWQPTGSTSSPWADRKSIQEI